MAGASYSAAWTDLPPHGPGCANRITCAEVVAQIGSRDLRHRAPASGRPVAGIGFDLAAPLPPGPSSVQNEAAAFVPVQADEVAVEQAGVRSVGEQAVDLGKHAATVDRGVAPGDAAFDRHGISRPSASIGLKPGLAQFDGLAGRVVAQFDAMLAAGDDARADDRARRCRRGGLGALRCTVRVGEARLPACPGYS